MQLLGAPSSHEFLKLIFQDRALRNSSYSLRAFARDLGLSVSTLSALFRQQSKLSRKKAQEVCVTLRLDVTLTEYFRLLVTAETAKSPEVTQASWNAVREFRSRHLYQNFLLEEAGSFEWSWLHACLMLLSRLGKLPNPCHDLQTSLPFEPQQLQQAMHDLVQAGWLKPSPEGMTAPLGYLYAPKPGPQIRALHRHMLQHNQYALDGIPVEQRTFAQNFITIRRCDYEKLASELSDLIRERCDRVESREQHDSVYSLSWQLIPLSLAHPNTASESVSRG